MKFLNLLPPVIALGALGVWLGPQRAEIRRIEEANILLREKIEHAQMVSARPSAEARVGQEAEKTASGIDWKRAATMAMRMERGDGDMQAMMDLQMQLMEMTTEELLSAVEEIATAGIPPKAAATLRQMLWMGLLERDPLVAMERHADLLEADNPWLLSHGLQRFADEDLTAAIAWLDRERESGALDDKSLAGINPPYLQLEGRLLPILVQSDPAMAKLRVARLSDEDRRKLLTTSWTGEALKDAGSQRTMMEIVREHLPEELRPAAVVQLTRKIAAEGFEEADAFIRNVAAGPKEIGAVVESAMSSYVGNSYYEHGLDPERLDEARKWAAAVDPENVDGATGKLLGQLSHMGEFSKVADQVIAYHDAGAGDDLLVPFLEQVPAYQSDALPLVERIEDEEARERLLKKFRRE